MADKIWIALEPDNITVDAGGPPLTILVAVQNMSTTVDHLIIEVEGLNPGWFALSGDVLHLFPEERGQSQLQLQVPSGSEVRAGSYPFTVRARSRTDPAEMGTARGTLEVRPYYSYQFDVTPRLAHGRQGSFRAAIQNAGIAEIEVQLRGSDPEALCRFDFQTERPRIAPGTTVIVPFTVTPDPSSAASQPRTFNLSVSASSDRSENRTVPIQLVQEVQARRGSPLLWVVLAGIVCFACLCVIATLLSMLSLSPGSASLSSVSMPTTGPAAETMATAVLIPMATSMPADTARPEPTFNPTPKPAVIVPSPFALIHSNGSATIRDGWGFDLDAGVGVIGGAIDVSWEQVDNMRFLIPHYGATVAYIGKQDFGSISLQTLTSLEYKEVAINGTNDSSNRLTTGTVIAVHTRTGRYAKMRIDTYGNDLRITWVTYA